jgi:hypothetical protein
MLFLDEFLYKDTIKVYKYISYFFSIMPSIIKINNNKYYNCVGIISEYKKIFVCCKKNIRDIIKKMKLRSKDYIFAYYNNKDKNGILQMKIIQKLKY